MLTGNERTPNVYRLTFLPDDFPAVQQIFAEIAERSMQRDQLVPRFAQAVLEREQPVVRVDFRPDTIRDLSEIMLRFAHDTDRALTDIAMEWPADLAEGLIADRRRAGQVAEELAQEVHMHAEFEEIKLASPDPDEWLGGQTG